jgi:hypothetical protein
MPRGDKSKYTNKEKRQERHIEKGYEERGVSEREAKRRAWATVNKVHGGGEKRGGGAAMRGEVLFHIERATNSPGPRVRSPHDLR